MSKVRVAAHRDRAVVATIVAATALVFVAALAGRLRRVGRRHQLHRQPAFPRPRLVADPVGVHDVPPRRLPAAGVAGAGAAIRRRRPVARRVSRGQLAAARAQRSAGLPADRRAARPGGRHRRRRRRDGRPAAEGAGLRRRRQRRCCGRCTRCARRRWRGRHASPTCWRRRSRCWRRWRTCPHRARRPRGGRRSARWWLASSALYLAAVLAKADAIPLPLVWLVLDVYPLRGGWGAPPAGAAAPASVACGSRSSLRSPSPSPRVRGGRRPRAGASLAGLDDAGIGPRLAHAAAAVWLYLGKTLAPWTLSPYYPRPPELARGLAAPLYAGAAIAAIGVTLLLGPLRAPRARAVRGLDRLPRVSAPARRPGAHREPARRGSLHVSVVGRRSPPPSPAAWRGSRAAPRRLPPAGAGAFGRWPRRWCWRCSPPARRTCWERIRKACRRSPISAAAPPAATSRTTGARCCMRPAALRRSRRRCCRARSQLSPRNGKAFHNLGIAMSMTGADAAAANALAESARLREQAAAR